MNYFAHQMPKDKIRKIVDELLTICDDMDHFEDKILDLKFHLSNPPISAKDRISCRNEIADGHKIREKIEQVFQAKLSVLSDFNYLARNYTSELLDEISEVNPDAVEEEAVNNSKTGRR